MTSIGILLLCCLSAVQASQLYLGCWADSPDNPIVARYGPPFDLDAKLGNIRTCLDYSYEESGNVFPSSPFIAVTRGEDCYLIDGNDWTMYGRRRDSECDGDCPDGTTGCGGLRRLAVYSTSLWYVGCVKDDGDNRIFSFMLYDEDADFFAQKDCVDKCTDGGYYMAGVQNGRQCWCGEQGDIQNVIAIANDAPESECNVPCRPQFPGGDETRCGGYNRMSVYHLHVRR